MSNIKILHIIDSAAPGGAQRVLDGLMRIDHPSIEQKALVLRKTTPALSIHQARFVPTEARYSLWPFPVLRLWIRTWQPHILHCHLLKSRIAALPAKWNSPFPLRLIFHEHGLPAGSEIGDPLESLLLRIIPRLAHSLVDRWLVPSHAAGQSLKRCTPVEAAKISVLHNFIDPGFFSSTKPSEEDIRRFRREMGVPEGKKVVGFAGRLVKNKGWRDVIEAARQARDRCPDLHFVLAGDGPERAAVQKETETTPNLTWVGHLSDMKLFYQAVDCLAVPSRWESFGLTALEAQASGTPLAAARTPGLRDLLHHEQDALLFAPGNASELLGCAARLLEDEDLRVELVDNGRNNARQYDRDRFWEQYLKMIFDMLGRE